MKMIHIWWFLVDIQKYNTFLELQSSTNQNPQIIEELFLSDFNVMFSKLELDGKYSQASEELKRKKNFKEKM